MVTKDEIDEILSEYDQEEISIGALCSHSALQIFHGARLGGFKTVGICPENRERTYRAFPRARPDEFLLVDQFDEILEEENQDKLVEENNIIVPHGSFVEYVGVERLLDDFYVPIFGNRNSLKWEGNRDKQREWLERAGVKVPKSYSNPSQIDDDVFVKFSGAKGGRGFFTASSEGEYEAKLQNKIEEGEISEEEVEKVTIQEFIPGNRFYPHYFHSLVKNKGAKTEDGAIEILGMDKRIEPIDESYRGLPDVSKEFFNYTVTGNEPVIVREKRLTDLLDMGTSVADASKKLFGGMNGPFCLETIYHPDEGFTAFEISGRIVAGTNLYPEGSPYSAYYFEEPMSTGRRIAREIKMGAEEDMLQDMIY